jgi:hypothetical protein
MKPLSFKSSASWTLWSLVAITVAAIAFGVFRLQPSAAKPQSPPRQDQPARPATLASFKPAVDLGTISMAAGNVPFRYLVKNTGTEALEINRVSTSCMCTSATVVTATERKGPFGMPGHGRPNATKLRLAPGELADVEVVFDPAAHGPSGLGRIERTVTLESVQAAPLELRMVVMVRP